MTNKQEDFRKNKTWWQKRLIKLGLWLIRKAGTKPLFRETKDQVRQRRKSYLPELEEFGYKVEKKTRTVEEELGYVSSLFMSQECKGVEIVMPTEELMESASRISQLIEQARQEGREESLIEAVQNVEGDLDSLIPTVLLIFGNLMHSTNAENMDMSVEGTLDGRRYKIKGKFELESLNHRPAEEE